MIGYLQGILRHVEDLDVIVDVNGVGYEVRVDRQTLETFGPIGEEVTLWVRTIVREDAFILHGFATRDHRLVFDMVTQVTGVGPKLGTQIVGGFPIAELVAAIRDKDLRLLSQIPGVGKKIAERLVLELSKKFIELPIAIEVAPKHEIPTVLLDDLRLALANLGFGPRDVEAAIRQVQIKDGDDLEGLVLKALAVLQSKHG